MWWGSFICIWVWLGIAILVLLDGIPETSATPQVLGALINLVLWRVVNIEILIRRRMEK